MMRQLNCARAAIQTSALLALLLAPVTGYATVSPTAAPPTTATQHDYLQRAQKYRQAGDLRHEQFQLTKALRAWPDSTALRHAYALHLVRRKNLNGTLIHTTHSLLINRDQPATANLHLVLLAGLDRSADGVAWVTEHLTLNKAQPPFELWSSDWLKRWQQVLQLGRRHAVRNHNTQALALIDGALTSIAPTTNFNNTKANGN